MDLHGYYDILYTEHKALIRFSKRAIRYENWELWLELAEMSGELIEELNRVYGVMYEDWPPIINHAGVNESHPIGETCGHCEVENHEYEEKCFPAYECEEAEVRSIYYAGQCGGTR